MIFIVTANREVRETYQWFEKAYAVVEKTYHWFEKTNEEGLKKNVKN